MKIILTGATGYIGTELLTACLSNPRITSIIALTRRDLLSSNPHLTNPKLRVLKITESDFLSYSDPALTDEIRGASACLWTIGITPAKLKELNEEEKRVISLDYLAAASKAFTELSSTDAKAGKKFRFIFISGIAAERDQERALWYWNDFWKLRGESENILLRHAASHSDAFEAYIMRPGLVPSAAGAVRDLLWGLVPSVRLDFLVNAMISLALRGNEKRIWENGEIKGFGQGQGEEEGKWEEGQ
ncbi:hypothetical protein BDW74DRAFT_162392 [Aspergillus multicolor]|uniref:putative nucleoside-diphosphate-sugar epimerase n=1 Tax=Aspergillus multicolor TaxID=41759 RepID=UPI003CCDBDBC